MRIARAELFELALPLLEPFVISGDTLQLQIYRGTKETTVDAKLGRQ